MSAAPNSATTAEEGARVLFRSLQRLKELPDHVEVLPGAFSGSVCGRRLSGKPSSTIGFERRHNAAFRIEDEDAFVQFMQEDIPLPPPRGGRAARHQCRFHGRLAGQRGMNGTKAPTTIGPQAYVGWRATSLGAITEAVEHRVILDLMGELAGRRFLDAGCGDGVLVCAAAARGAVATGVDPDPAMLAAARLRVGRCRARGDLPRGPGGAAAFSRFQLRRGRVGHRSLLRGRRRRRVARDGAGAAARRAPGARRARAMEFLGGAAPRARLARLDDLAKSTVSHAAANCVRSSSRRACRSRRYEAPSTTRRPICWRACWRHSIPGWAA